jgi:hypothetical protein
MQAVNGIAATSAQLVPLQPLLLSMRHHWYCRCECGSPHFKDLSQTGTHKTLFQWIVALVVTTCIRCMRQDALVLTSVTNGMKGCSSLKHVSNTYTSTRLAILASSLLRSPIRTCIDDNSSINGIYKQRRTATACTHSLYRTSQ